MSFEVTVTPTVYNVEVEVNPSVQPFDVQVVANKDLSDLVNEAKQYADDAEDSADSASASASSATTQAQNAQASANSASASASSALASAQASAQSAQDAEDAVNSLTFGDLTEATSSVLTITGGTDAVFGNGTSIQVKQASGSQSGFLSSSDWTAFNSKLDSIALTTSGNSGASTYIAGTLNIPNYTLAGLGGEPLLGYTPENVANKSTLTTLGTSDTLYPTQNAVKSYVDTGLSGKQNTLTNPITGTGTSGQVSFFNGTTTQTGDNGLFWDNVNKRLGIGTNSLSIAKVTITNSSTIPNAVWVNTGNPLVTTFAETTSGNGDVIYSMASSTTSTRSVFVGRKSAGTLSSPTVLTAGHQIFSLLASGFDGSAFQNPSSIDFEVESNASSGSVPTLINLVTGTTGANRTPKLQVRSNGNVLIQNGGTFTDAGFRLDVNGTARVQGTLTVQTATGGTAPWFTPTAIMQGTGAGYYMQNTGAGGGFGALNIGGASGNLIASFDSIKNFVIQSTNGSIFDNRFQIFGNGNITINTTTDAGFRLDVNGTARVQGNLTLTGGSRATIGQIQLFDNVAGVREINVLANQGLRIGANSTSILLNNSAGFGQLLLSASGTDGRIAFRPNGSGNTAILFSAVSSSPSNAIITFNRLRVDGAKSAIINTEDFAISGASPVEMYIYAGKETVLNNQGNLFLAWDGGSSRGNVNIGGGSNNASAIVNIQSTTKGFLPPRLTTTERNAIATPATGLEVYNSTNNSKDIYNGSAWVNVVSSSNFDGLDIAFGTTTGTKIGTATSQKLSFWNATPNVQPTTAITAGAFVANTSGITDDTATFDGYTIGQVVAALRRIGALA